MRKRKLGSTGIEVSPLGLGTVKFGRNQGVKYPSAFEIPDDASVRSLLSIALDAGVNLLDTAPAYGESEERLGRLLPGRREDWVVVSKVGEQFHHGFSTFDYSREGTLASIHASLSRLKTDYLDAVLVHSDGNDIRILEDEPVMDTLRELKQQGVIRSFGMSSKTVEGGLRVVECSDIVMATCNTAYNDELPVLQAAEKAGKGVLVKKALQSGHATAVAESFRFVFSQPGVSSVVIGTISPAHLLDNIAIVSEILDH